MLCKVFGLLASTALTGWPMKRHIVTVGLAACKIFSLRGKLFAGLVVKWEFAMFFVFGWCCPVYFWALVYIYRWSRFEAPAGVTRLTRGGQTQEEVIFAFLLSSVVPAFNYFCKMAAVPSLYLYVRIHHDDSLFPPLAVTSFSRKKIFEPTRNTWYSGREGQHY